MDEITLDEEEVNALVLLLLRSADILDLVSNDDFTRDRLRGWARVLLARLPG